MTFRYIAVEGPPGAGKSELSQRLAAQLDGAALQEEKNNPFLRDCLAGKSGAAFQAQIFFLLSRYRQLSELAQRELFSQTRVSDFVLARDKIYAYLNLDDTELMLYEKIYGPLAVEVPSPELVIYLQVPARCSPSGCVIAPSATRWKQTIWSRSPGLTITSSSTIPRRPFWW